MIVMDVHWGMCGCALRVLGGMCSQGVTREPIPIHVASF